VPRERRSGEARTRAIRVTEARTARTRFDGVTRPVTGQPKKSERRIRCRTRHIEMTVGIPKRSLDERARSSG